MRMAQIEESSTTTTQKAETPNEFDATRMSAEVNAIKTSQEEAFKFFNTFLANLFAHNPGQKTHCITAEIGMIDTQHVHITNVIRQRNHPYIFKLYYKDICNGDTGLLKLNLRGSSIDFCKNQNGINYATIYTVNERPVRLLIKSF